MERLYYSDAYLMKVTAAISDVKSEQDRLWVALDRSIFYPGGGGQLPDRGTLAGWPLIEIREKQEKWWYGLDGKAGLKSGQQVELKLDENWRHYNMQQHSGQHLLSCVLDDFSLPTVSVHLGEEYTTVEVEGAVPDQQILDKIEDRANRIIRQGLPIYQRWVSREEAAKLPLRKEPGAWERLRVVEIEKIDYSACGGTHVKNTSEIGYIKISGVEKIRGRARIQAHIGARADELFKKLSLVSGKVKQELQDEPEKFAERIRGLKKEIKQYRNDLASYRDGFLRYRAEQILRSYPDQPFIHFRWDDLTAGDVSDTARLLSTEFDKVAIGFCGERFYLTAPSGHFFDSSRFVREKGKELGMRGGGPPGFTQGLAPGGQESRIINAIKDEIKKINN